MDVGNDGDNDLVVGDGTFTVQAQAQALITMISATAINTGNMAATMLGNAKSTVNILGGSQAIGNTCDSSQPFRT